MNTKIKSEFQEKSQKGILLLLTSTRQSDLDLV